MLFHDRNSIRAITSASRITKPPAPIHTLSSSQKSQNDKTGLQRRHGISSLPILPQRLSQISAVALLELKICGAQSTTRQVPCPTLPSHAGKENKVCRTTWPKSPHKTSIASCSNEIHSNLNSSINALRRHIRAAMKHLNCRTTSRYEASSDTGRAI